MRNAFVKELGELAGSDPNVMLLTGDLGFKVFDDFIAKYPQQFLNLGVAEANMAGVAAGLAMDGKCPYMYSIAPFATLRCYEQIRNDICFHNANVKVVGVGGGLSYGPNCPTHHALMDIAIMRALPGMTVLCPGDPVETYCATRAAFLHKGPVYIRLGRSNEAVLHSSRPYFEIGKGMTLRDGNEIALLSTGNMLETALRVAEQLASQRSCRVISFSTMKPFDTDLVKSCLREFPWIFTLEEHSIIGGLGSAVAEVALTQTGHQARVKCFAAPDRLLHQTGSHEYLRKLAGLSVEQILNEVQVCLREESYAHK